MDNNETSNGSGKPDTSAQVKKIITDAGGKSSHEETSTGAQRPVHGKDNTGNEHGTRPVEASVGAGMDAGGGSSTEKPSNEDTDEDGLESEEAANFIGTMVGLEAGIRFGRHQQTLVTAYVAHKYQRKLDRASNHIVNLKTALRVQALANHLTAEALDI